MNRHVNRKSIGISAVIAAVLAYALTTLLFETWGIWASRMVWALTLGMTVAIASYGLARTKGLRGSVDQSLEENDILRRRIDILSRDDTTGTFHRVIAMERLAELGGLDCDVTVAIVDVNGLKKVNDTLGHHMGDEMLRYLCTRLSILASHGRLVARLGGDEFLVLASETDVHTLADEIDIVLSGDHPFGDGSIAAVGVARTRHGATRYAMACADLAMYRSKDAFYDTGTSSPTIYDVVKDEEPDAQIGPHDKIQIPSPRAHDRSRRRTQRSDRT